MVSIKMAFSYPKEMEIAKKRWPILIPIGTMEYHSTICPYGCDALEYLFSGTIKLERLCETDDWFAQDAGEMQGR